MTQDLYRAVAKYRIHGPDGNKRVYHANDTHHTGPSIPLKAFHQGERPPAYRPTVEMYATPDTLRLAVERQQARQAGQVPEAPPPPRPRINHLACKACGHTTCRCGVPALGDMGQRILALQRQQGKRP